MQRAPHPLGRPRFDARGDAPSGRVLLHPQEDQEYLALADGRARGTAARSKTGLVADADSPHEGVGQTAAERGCGGTQEVGQSGCFRVKGARRGKCRLTRWKRQTAPPSATARHRPQMAPVKPRCCEGDAVKACALFEAGGGCVLSASAPLGTCVRECAI
eukprot:scaffold30143_cov112-Isochrysis_galbana.AAC.1